MKILCRFNVRERIEELMDEAHTNDMIVANFKREGIPDKFIKRYSDAANDLRLEANRLSKLYGIAITNG